MRNPKTGALKMNIDIESIDIPTMHNMSDEQYRSHVRQFGLMYVDHHDVLRSAIADYPLATTREQFDILIEEMKLFRNKMEARG